MKCHDLYLNWSLLLYSTPITYMSSSLISNYRGKKGAKKEKIAYEFSLLHKSPNIKNYTVLLKYAFKISGNAKNSSSNSYEENARLVTLS